MHYAAVLNLSKHWVLFVIRDIAHICVPACHCWVGQESVKHAVMMQWCFVADAVFTHSHFIQLTTTVPVPKVTVHAQRLSAKFQL